MNRANLEGQRFGRLTAISLTEKRTCGGNSIWLCRCDCGNEALVSSSSLKNGGTRSCGCLAKEITSKRMKENSYRTTHHGSSERLYLVWKAIINRCYNEKDGRYKDYGGRGIKVCNEWKNDYSAFRSFALNNGYKPNGKYGDSTIDRIDVDGDYCPENCRFVNLFVQENNRRNNHNLTYKGRTQTIAQWAKETGIKPGTLYSRIERGWSVDRALNTYV